MFQHAFLLKSLLRPRFGPRKYCNLAMLPVQKFNYDMPAKYRDSFYLANASFFDNSNWFIHRAYEVTFSDLVQELQKRESTMDDRRASMIILDTIKNLDLCNELLDINIGIKRGKYRKEIIRGYRAHHGITYLNRPCLGGLRLGKAFRKDHCKALAVLTTYRNNCVGVNLAGSHGVLKVTPGMHKESEVEEAVENYTKELAKLNFVGPNIDIVEPDLCSGPKEMSFVTKAMAESHLVSVACAVGKNVDKGGFANYQDTITSGVFVVIEHFLNDNTYMEKVGLDVGLKDKTFIIQGLGKTGGRVAKLLEKAGAKCVGVKEVEAYLYLEEGINVDAILEHKAQKGTILGFCKTVKPYEVYDIFKEPCDLLILAADHKSLQCYLADKVQAKVVVEVANGGVTPSANKILMGRKKMVIPDILLNAGCSLASYFEYMKNVEGITFDKIVAKYTNEQVRQVIQTEKSEEDVVRNAMKSIILNMLKEVLTITEKYKLGVDVRTAAYVNAVNRIFKGIFDSKRY